MKKIALAFAIGILTTAVAQAGPVYRWKDQNGNYTYSDRPTHPRAEIFTAEDGAPPADEPLSANELRRSQKCAASQAELRRYKTYDSIVVVSSQEGGEREMTDEERQRAITNAEQDVEVWCNRAAPPPAEPEPRGEVTYGNTAPASPERLRGTPPAASRNNSSSGNSDAERIRQQREDSAQETRDAVQAPLDRFSNFGGGAPR